MVVTSHEEGIVMSQGSYKSLATAQAAVRREMAVRSQLFLLLFLDFYVLFPVPAHGKPPAHSTCPGPLSNTLHTTFMLAPTFAPLCGPDSPRTRTRRLADPFRTRRLAQALRETFSFGTWEWDTVYRSTMDSQPAGPHTSGVTTVFSIGKVSPRPDGKLTHYYSGVLQPGSARTLEGPEHTADQELQSFWNVSRQLAEREFYKTRMYLDKEPPHQLDAV